LVVVEDLHWIDAETQALLDGLVESLPAARLMLLVSYRPEYQHAWGGQSCYTQLRLDALPPESAEELLRALVGDEPTLLPLKRRLIAHTDGNPFFLEETVRALVETRALVGERGTYRLAADGAAPQVAPSIQAILAARIDRLPPDDKRLLQSAAVVGRDVPFALLRAIADLPEDELRRGLAHLQAAEFLYERSLFPDLELTFKHALTHEVAYGGILHRRRRVLHARIVDAIESTAGDRLAERVERLAYHAVRGDMWPKALHYLRQAYARAMARSAQREAAAFAEQALAALARLPESRDTIEQAVDLRFQLRHALWALGEFGRIRVSLVEAERLADALGDRRRGWVALYLCGWLYGAAEHDRAIEAGERAVALGADLGDRTLLALALVNLGQAQVARTDYERASETERRAVELLGGDLLRDRLGQGSLPSVLARVQLVRGLVELGRFTESIAVADEAVRIAEEAGHQGSLAIALIGSGVLHLRLADAPSAIAAFGRGLSISRELGFPTYAHWLAPGLAAAYTLAGRPAEAVPLLEQSLAEGAASGLTSQESLTMVYLGEALLVSGREQEALERATEALRLAVARHERGYKAFALRLLGDIAARRDSADSQAESAYREALRLAGDLGMRPLAAHCQLALGELYRRTGARDRSRQCLATAAALYDELGVARWLGRAEAAVAEDG
jgi:tetratricopeptide (TPR) repeat protein